MIPKVSRGPLYGVGAQLVRHLKAPFPKADQQNNDSESNYRRGAWQLFWHTLGESFHHLAFRTGPTKDALINLYRLEDK
jgi:hypothetical protein